MNKETLKQIIIEEVKKLLEYEYFVDDNGWAHDDEGNKWFVGKGTGQGTFGLRNMPRSHRSGFSSSPKKSYASFPSGTTNELIKAISMAIESARSEKTKLFLESVLGQYKTRGKLSDKQKEVLKRIFSQVGLSETEVKLIDMQG